MKREDFDPLETCCTLEQLRTAVKDAFNNEERDDGDLIQDFVLNFCCCGNAEASLMYVLGGLELIDILKEELWNIKDQAKRDEWWKDYNVKQDLHFGSAGARYFFYYWLDHEGLTEHGGSVPGWLDARGENLLEILREWKQLEQPK
jgi:hypothetical protein